MDKLIEKFYLLREQGTLRAIDLYFADFTCAAADAADPRLYAAAAMASWAVGQNNTCFDMADFAGKEFPASGDRDKIAAFAVLPELEEWLSALQNYPLIVGGSELNPLTLDGSRLYLRRYWDYESALADAIRARTRICPHYSSFRPFIKQRLAACFPDVPADGKINPQKLAAFAALRSRISIISGGPGTGKTFTAARILALLIERELHADPNRKPRILMAAPTGKAAARLKESVHAARSAAPGSSAWLDCTDEIKQLIPEEAQTIHRLLGAIPGSSRFRRNADNPIRADILLLDEASMIPLPLMAGIFAAMPPDSGLVLLGDMHQLSSVEPGYVYGDICAAARPQCFSPEFRREYEAVTGECFQAEDSPRQDAPLSDSAVQLTESRRFPPGSPIDRISRAVNSADTPEAAEYALELVKNNGTKEVTFTRAPAALYNTDRRVLSPLRNLIIENFRGYLNAETTESAFRELERFRILCALRNGPFGVIELNRIAEEVLSFRHLKDGNREQSGIRRPLETEQRYYHRQPIMILRNDYNLGLFNGDIGIIREVESENGPELRAFFRLPPETPGENENFYSFSLAALPEHETVFAMTVHKSQGSEFDRLLLLLPPHTAVETVTRELIYTGITRARQQVMLWADEDAFRHAIRRRTRRSSGLQHKLLGNL